MMRQENEKSYSELITIPTFKERLEYLQIYGSVGEETFGSARWLNQKFYTSKEFSIVRNKVIVRDLFGDQVMDMALDGYPILGHVYVHHINPITQKDILNRSSKLFDLNNLVCVSFDTHQRIHYGGVAQDIFFTNERRKNDTCPWKKMR